jgi:hypothetical protein
MVLQEAPASVGQRLMAMIAHYRGRYGALSCPVVCRLRGSLDVACLQAALDGVTAQHEALRTTFSGRGPGLTQLVQEPRPLPLAEIELDKASIDDAIAQELSDPIDIAAWPTRATLWRTGPQDHVLCVNIHHIVTDAWSSGLIFNELRDRYAQARGAVVTLPRTVWQYRDFVAWQEDLLAGSGLDRHRVYWQRQLAELSLPRMPYRDPAPGEGAHVATLDLPAPVVDGLREMARRLRTTSFTVALSVFYVVLNRLCEQDDLAVASLFANRSRREAQGTVGFLANMVVLRTRMQTAGPFADLVRATHATVMGAFAHQEQPYQTLPGSPAPSAGRADDVVFQMMAELDFRGTSAGVEFELLVPERIGSRFGVELALAPVGGGLRALLFHTSRLDRSVAAAMLRDYGAAAAVVAADPTVAVAAIGG